MASLENGRKKTPSTYISIKFIKGISQILLLILQDCHPNQVFQGLIIFSLSSETFKKYRQLKTALRTAYGLYQLEMEGMHGGQVSVQSIQLGR